MDEAKKKQYGLILKAKTEEKKIPVRAAALFDDNDDDDDKVDVSGTSRSAASLRVMKQAERQHQLAEAEDPKIFDYDANYEVDERRKNAKIEEQKMKDSNRQAKYAENLMKAKNRRELEKQSVEERKQQRERLEEQGQFADKEVFITGPYRKQMEEVKKFREEEEYDARFNAATAVQKQEIWQAGFARHMLSQLTRDEDEGEQKKRNTRQRLQSGGDDEEENDPKKKNLLDEKKAKKKSIYDSDPEDEMIPKAPSPAHKNFPNALQPGLNRATKKTKAEAVKERQFTPTPPSSDDEDREGQGLAARRHSHTEPQRGDSNGGQRRRKDSSPHRRRSGSPRREEKEVPVKKEKKKDEKTLKKERFENLKALVARRNGDKEIKGMKERYFQRLDSGFVTLPL